MNQGRLIVVEGADGSGKSSVLKLISQDLNARGYDVVNVREPGGSFAAEECRDILKSHDLSPLAAFHLMRAASIDLHSEVIIPSLEVGKIVLSDRCTWASACAYQGSHLGVEFILSSIVNDPYGVPVPDLAMWFDVSLEESQNRRDARGEDEDNFADLSEAIEIYGQLAEFGMLTPVDANRSLDIVQTSAMKLVDCVLESQPYNSRPNIKLPEGLIPQGILRKNKKTFDKLANL